MADYPLPRFHFQVDWGGAKINFMEVTGLNEEVEVMEYRHSGSPNFSKIKQPGLRKYGNITLKRGVFEQDFDYYNWLAEIANERVNNRRDVVIRLLNEKHEPVAVWKVSRAFPSKITAPDFKSDANEIAMESIEVVHEGLSLVR